MHNRVPVIGDEALERKTGRPVWWDGRGWSYTKPKSVLPGLSAPLIAAAQQRPSSIPLSFSQSRLWFLHLLDSGADAYKRMVVFQFSGSFDHQAFEQAVNAIIHRHEVLRTHICELDGNPVQVVDSDFAITIPVEQVVGDDKEAQQAGIRAAIDQEKERAFDLRTGPMLRMRVLRLAEKEHLLIFSSHHIAFDAWSEAVFSRELALLYDAFHDQRENPLRPLPLQYADFAIWQHQAFSDANLAPHLEYWREQLRGIPAELRLPRDRPRPARASSAGGLCRATIESADLDHIRQFSQDNHSTLYMTLLAAFGVLLARYSGQDDIVVGSAIANRQNMSLEQLMGLFVNTLVMRLRVMPDMAFGDFLASVRKTALNAYQHQDVPFERLVEELAPSRSMAITPVYQVSFEVQNAPAEMWRLKDLKIVPYGTEEVTARGDLEVHAVENAGRIEFYWVYSSDLFDPWRIEQMARHYVRLLRNAIEAPARPLRKLTFLDDTERCALIEFGFGPRKLLSGKTVVEMFEEQAARTPDASALVCGMRTFNYGQLDESVNRLAVYLSARGVKPEVVVGVCLDRSPELVISLLAILKAGGAYLPLDSALPSSRLEAMLSDAAPLLVLSSRGVRKEFPGMAPVVFLDTPALQSVVDEDAGSDAPKPVMNLPLPAHPAYVIYTSGSSGQPKGVVMLHSALANKIRGLNEYLAINSHATYAALAGISFDPLLEQLLCPLCAGARCLIVPDNIRNDPASLTQYFAGCSISILDATPGLIEGWMSAGWMPRDLEALLVGGEIFPLALMDSLRRSKGAKRILNMYGPTEACIDALIYEIGENDITGQVPIGKPCANYSVYVLDEMLQPAPIGNTGELYISGEGLARGYVGKAALTSERFVANPFGNESSRMYRTGDLARWRPDGHLEFMGRADQQVKLRGYRIELEEVEAAILRCSSVASCCVQVEGEGPEAALIAYVAANRSELEWWPSLGEYSVYDELLYRAMTEDKLRSEAYKDAIHAVVKDKIVVDIGTGGDALLACYCAAAGAKRVYAIEVLEDAFESARREIERQGFGHIIELVRGDSQKVDLPELADVCVSEIIGTIGSSEGVVPVLADARRFLRPSGTMIPHRCITKIAAVSWGNGGMQAPRFGPLQMHYAQSVFQKYGTTFDLRVCVKNFSKDNICSSTGVFEDLAFNQDQPCRTEKGTILRINRNCKLHGLILWINLYVDGARCLDSMESRLSWLPVFFPAFHPALSVSDGDTITLTCSSQPGKNPPYPDYRIKGTLHGRGGQKIQFDYESPHIHDGFQQSSFYVSLFSDYTSASARNEDLESPLDFRPSEVLSTAEIRSALQQQLPAYMVPGRFIVLDTLPVGATGKIDRKALRSLKAHPGNDFMGPSTPQQEILCGIFAQVLGLESIGVNNNFFELGGHSLSAMQLIGRIRSVFGIELPLRTIFEAPTVACLAAYLGNTEKPGATLSKRVRPEHIPLSYGQQRLWFINQLQGNSPEYNISVALLLRGELHRGALEQAFNYMLERHENLRTRFAEDGGQPIQVISPFSPCDLSFTDLSALQHLEQEKEVESVLDYESSRSLDLKQGPLFRVRLLKLQEREHVLVRTTHHIVFDGWSEAIFARELAELYRAFCQGNVPTLPVLPLQYADYVLWQREVLDQQTMEHHLRYWREELAGMPDQLDLPSDGLVARTTLSGGAVLVSLDTAFSGKLRQFSLTNKATTYMSLLAAFALLLARYSGQDDIVIGSPIANRPTPELEGLIGFFVNSLVMRIRVDQAKNFNELLSAVRATALQAYQHQDLPFEKLVEELAPPRVAGMNPLFQVSFALQNAPWPEYSMHDLELKEVGGGNLKMHNDLEVHVWPGNTQFSIYWMYRRDLFGHERISQMAHHYVQLVQWLVSHPQMDFRFAGLMSTAEREMILLEWNRTRDDFSCHKCLHELFDEQAEKMPGAIAGVCGEQEISYADLKARADRLAIHLQGLGVAPEARVGLFSRRNINMVVGLLGVLKAGAAYIPIDAGLPMERIVSILADAAPAIVLTESELLTGLPENRYRYVVIDSLEPLDAGTRPVRPLYIFPKMAAYVLYTSGSTGRPKGVVVEHRQVINYVHGVVKRAGFLRGSSFAMVQPLAVDSSVTMLFSSLCHGGTLHLLSEDTITDPDALGNYLARQKIDYLKIAPSHLAALQAGDAPDRFVPRTCLIVGGEASAIDWLNAIQNMAQNCTVFNHYGPTETTVGVLMYRLGSLALTSGPAPLGTPMANARIYVLDKTMQPVPVGITGELYVAGECLARGYLNRPGATAERFIANPFGPTGSRLYRTGDLVRWRNDGNLDFLGRADSQLKVRGYRVELAEIETALRKHPLVQDAVVSVHGQGEQRCLVAYVVPRPYHADREHLAQSHALAASADHLATPPADAFEMKASLREHLRQSLPSYMVPSAIMVLKSWPLTPHGKLDRRALPAPELGSEVYHAPETQLEELICRVFAEVLGLEWVSIDDNLFELGAHSLAILRIRYLLRTRSGHDIPVVDFFAHPSVRSLARRMEAGADPIKTADSQERASKLKSYLRERQTAILSRNASKAEVGE